MALRQAGLAMLGQKRALLYAIKPEHYRSMSPLVGASIGQHLRHSIDHFAKLLGAVETRAGSSPGRQHSGGIPRVSYDVRSRGTTIESDPEVARQEVDRLERLVRDLPDHVFEEQCHAVFILSAEGASHAFTSTVGRELGFCVHHAIHHHHTIKVIATSMGYQLPSGFGLAPSTANYKQTAGASS